MEPKAAQPARTVELESEQAHSPQARWVQVSPHSELQEESPQAQWPREREPPYSREESRLEVQQVMQRPARAEQQEQLVSAAQALPCQLRARSREPQA
jgi:hypothetical protein